MTSRQMMKQCAKACFQSTSTMTYHYINNTYSTYNTRNSCDDDQQSNSNRFLSLMMSSLQFMSIDMIDTVVTITKHAQLRLDAGDVHATRHALQQILIGCQDDLPPCKAVLSSIIVSLTQAIARAYFQHERYADALACAELSFDAYRGEHKGHIACAWFDIACLRILASDSPSAIVAATRNAYTMIVKCTNAQLPVPTMPQEANASASAMLSRNVTIVMTMKMLAEEQDEMIRNRTVSSSCSSYQSALMHDLIMHMHNADGDADGDADVDGCDSSADVALTLHLLSVKFMSNNDHAVACRYLVQEVDVRRNIQMQQKQQQSHQQQNCNHGQCESDLCITLARLGQCYQSMRQEEHALRCYQLILNAKLHTVLSESVAMRDTIIHALYEIGTALAKRASRTQKKPEFNKKALDLLEMGLGICQWSSQQQQQRDASLEFKLLFSIGMAQMGNGNYSKAGEFYIQAAALAHDVRGKFDALRFAALAQQRQQNFGSSADLFRDALAAMRDSPEESSLVSTHVFAGTHTEYGRVLKELGRLDDALQSFHEAARWIRHSSQGCTPSRRHRAQIQILNEIGFLELQRSNCDQAKAFFAEASILSGTNAVASAAAA